MRWLLLLAVTFGLLGGPKQVRAAVAADPASALAGGLIARVHFVGTDRISADANATRLKELAALPETAALRAFFLAKAATIPYREYQTRLAGTNECTELISPLLDDLLRGESFLEARSSANAFPETILAVRLDGARAALWQTNLAAVLTTWTHLPIRSIKSGNFAGWELKKDVSPALIRFFRAGDWVVLGLGDGDLALMPGVLQRIADQKRPVDAAADYWLDAAADWPALAARQLVPGTIPLSKVRLIVQGRKGEDGTSNVRQQVTADFSHPLGLDLKPWRIPTNLIHSPVISFSAARGLASGLAGLTLVKTLNAAPLPDEFFTWANGNVPVEFNVAALVRQGDPTNYLDRIAPGVVALVNTALSVRQLKMGATLTNHEIHTWGLPFVSPFLRAMEGPTGAYLVGGLLPAPVRIEPLPPPLINEVESKPNLVYYDWELTGPRLNQTRPNVQLYSIVSGQVLGVKDTVPAKWLDAAAPKLGNCGTVVTLTGPSELTLVRNSSVGLSASELTLLAYWLESPGFPYNAEHELRPGMQRAPGP